MKLRQLAVKLPPTAVKLRQLAVKLPPTAVTLPPTVPKPWKSSDQASLKLCPPPTRRGRLVMEPLRKITSPLCLQKYNFFTPLFPLHRQGSFYRVVIHCKSVVGRETDLHPCGEYKIHVTFAHSQQPLKQIMHVTFFYGHYFAGKMIATLLLAAAPK